MDEEKITLKTTEWTQMVKKIAYMEKALDHLVNIYHRALEEHQDNIGIRDVADVIEIAEAEREVEII